MFDAQESLVNPLDKHTKMLYPEQGNGMFQYYVKVRLQPRGSCAHCRAWSGVVEPS